MIAVTYSMKKGTKGSQLGTPNFFLNWAFLHPLYQGFSTFWYPHTPKSKWFNLCIPPKSKILPKRASFEWFFKFHVPPVTFSRTPRGRCTQPLFLGTLVFCELAPCVLQKVHFTVLEPKIAILTQNLLVN
jgi:hypothetical protein